MEPLTIVKILYAPPHVGGSGAMGIELGRELSKKGHDVHIVSYPNTKLSRADRKLLTLHSIPDITYGSFKVSPTGLTLPGTIAMLAKEIKIDIVHAHYAVTHGEAAVDARDILNRKYPGYPTAAVITNHGTDVSVNGYKDVMAPGLELKLSQADATTYVSKSLQEEAKRVFDLEDYGQVISNFINAEPFLNTTEADRVKVRKKHNIPMDSLVFYHVSNLRPVKNVPLIFEAMAKILAGGNKAHLMIVGDGPDRAELEEQVSAMGLGDYVTFTGKVVPEKVPVYTKAGDVMLLPSTKESFGLVNLEAMYTGNAVIASDAGGIPEVIDHGISGFLFPSRNSEALAAMMMKFICAPGLSGKMGEQGKLIAAKRFDPASIATQYENIYYEALEKRMEGGQNATISLVS